jgi:hypothetical protein
MVCRLEPIPDSAIEYFDGTVIARGAVDSIRKRIGIWHEYHNTGEFRAKGVYKEGKRIGNWEFFYSSGSLEQKGGYNKKGNEQGPWIWFYESGKTMRQENYVNGNREGELIDYNELGEVILKGNYSNNNKEGLWLYETKEYKEIGKYSFNYGIFPRTMDHTRLSNYTDGNKTFHFFIHYSNNEVVVNNENNRRINLSFIKKEEDDENDIKQPTQQVPNLFDSNNYDKNFPPLGKMK